MVINTSKSRLDKIAWLHKQEEITKFSNLQLQKFLFFYEMFQYSDRKEYDFDSLKAYKNGPVFSKFYGDFTYRENEVISYLDSVDDGIKIDEDNAKVSKFIIETMTDSELSELTHEFNMWKIHQDKIAVDMQQIPMDEKDISDDDIELLQLLKISQPSYDYKILEIGNKRFVFSKENFKRLSKRHIEVLKTLRNNEELINPVYIELDPEERLLID